MLFRIYLKSPPILSTGPYLKRTRIILRQRKSRISIAVIPLLIGIIFFCCGHRAMAQIKAISQLQREEKNTTSPFGPYRERSSQSIIYNHYTPYLASEFEFRHVIFKDLMGTAEKKFQFYQASFRGQNMTSPLVFKVGRIWTGNEKFRPIDGASWFYPFGRRLTTSLEMGRMPMIDDNTSHGNPGYMEGRIQYRLNDSAFLAFQGLQDLKDRYSSTLLGYEIESLKVLGEYRSSGATDTYRISLQYYDGSKCDITSDYRLNMNDKTDSGVLRNTIGLEVGELYFESGAGSKFFYGDGKIPKNVYYEGNVFWGGRNKRKDSLNFGYLLETGNASSARTLSGTAERVVSPRTKISIGLTDTRFDEGRSSIQNLESKLHRKVEWGFYELRFAFITGGDNSELGKDFSLRAGYEF